MNYPELNLKTLYRIGGVICFILLAYSLITLIVMSLIGGPPLTAGESFSILQENTFKGLLRLKGRSIQQNKFMVGDCGEYINASLCSFSQLWNRCRKHGNPVCYAGRAFTNGLDDYVYN